METKRGKNEDMMGDFSVFAWRSWEPGPVLSGNRRLCPLNTSLYTHDGGGWGGGVHTVHCCLLLTHISTEAEVLDTGGIIGGE